MKYKYEIKKIPTDTIKQRAALTELAKFREVRSKHSAGMSDYVRKLKSKANPSEVSNYIVNFSLGKHKFSYKTVAYPGAVKIREIYKMAGDVLRNNRKRWDMVPKKETKQLGSFSYTTVGGVFTHSIKSDVKRLADKDVILKDKAPHRMSQHNHLGIEIEFVSPLRSDVIRQMLIDAKLATYVTIKQDGSLRPNRAEDFCHEITMLCTEREAREKLTLLCDMLNGDKIKGYVNDRCGLHVHLDMRRRNVKMAYNNLVQCYPLLSSLIPRSRLNNEYCRPNESTDMDDTTGEGRFRRYQAINNMAYVKFKTLEVRLHHGTLDAARIYNWIQTLVAPADMVTPITAPVYNADEYASYFKVADDLFTYLKQRAADMKTCRTVDEDLKKYTMVG